jgi:hypothetical protein
MEPSFASGRKPQQPATPRPNAEPKRANGCCWSTENQEEVLETPTLDSGGKGGYITVIRGDRWSILPMHRNQKELGTGLVNQIKKDLGLK